MLSFPITIRPFLGESLLSFLARTGEANGRSSIAQVLQAAGLEAEFILSAPYRNFEPSLAELLGMSVEQFDLMSYRTDSKNRKKVSELGRLHCQPVRRKHISTQIRRFSPTSLSKKLYHRALWDLKPLPFCTESGELLISSCPACGRTLKWKSINLVLCGNPDCRFDLRRAESESVSKDALDAGRFLAGLMSPVKTEQAETRKSLHKNLAALNNAELLDLVILIGIAESHRSDDGWKAAHTKIAAGNFSGWGEFQLLAAVAALKHWQYSFRRILEELDSFSYRREGSFGLRKHFGILAELVDVSKHSRRVVRIFESEFNDVIFLNPQINVAPSKRHNVSSNHRTIALTEAASILGISEKRLRRVAIANDFVTTTPRSGAGTPIRIDREIFDPLRVGYPELVSPNQIQCEFGIRPWTLRNLLGDELIAPVLGPERHFRPENYVSRQNVRVFLEGIEQRASLDEGMPLENVVEPGRSPSLDPLFILLKGLASGTIPVGLDKAHSKIGQRFIVDPIIARNQIRYARDGFCFLLTLAEAAEILGCHTEVVKELIALLGIPFSRFSVSHKIDAREFYEKTRDLIPGWKMMELLSCSDSRTLIEEARIWRLSPSIRLKTRSAVFFDVKDFRDPDQLSLLKPRKRPWMGPLFGTDGALSARQG